MRLGAGPEAVPEEAGRETVHIEGLGAERIEAFGAAVVGEADHALHGGEGLFGEVTRSEAAFGPGHGARADLAGTAQQDVPVVGLADVAHRLEAVGHVLDPGGVLVASVLAAMDGDPRAAAFEEHLDHALAGAHRELAADMAFGHRVMVAVDPDVAVLRDLAGQPLTPFPKVGRQRLEVSPFVRLEEGAAALAGRHRRLVEPVELAPDRGVHRLQRKEGLVAQHQQDAGLDRAHCRLDLGLVGRLARARRQHGETVVPGEVAEARIEPGLLAVRLVDAGLEVVDDPALRRGAEVFQRAAMRHRPVAHALVGHRLGVSHVGVRQHRDEDLDILLAAPGAQAQRLAGEVRQAPQPRRVVEAHPRLPAVPLQPRPEPGAELAVAVGRIAARQRLVAIFLPQLKPGQPGAAALAGRGERLDDRIPVGLRMAAVALRRRIELLPKRIVVETLRQRPGQTRSRRALQNMRHRPRAYPGRRHDPVACQAKTLTLPKNVLDVVHADPLHRAPAPSLRSIDR